MDKKVDQYILAYIAGFFDGEGSIVIPRRYTNLRRGCKFSLSVRIVNTYKPVIDLCQRLFGGYVYEKPIEKSHHKQAYQWYVNAQKGEDFLKLILPYLVVKKEEAEIAMEFRNMQRELNEKRMSNNVRKSYSQEDFKVLFNLREHLLSLRGAAANRRRLNG